MKKYKFVAYNTFMGAMYKYVLTQSSFFAKDESTIQHGARKSFRRLSHAMLAFDVSAYMSYLAHRTKKPTKSITISYDQSNF